MYIALSEDFFEISTSPKGRGKCISLALTLGELSSVARLRGLKRICQIGYYQAPSLRELSAKLTEGVTHLPFPTLSPLPYPNIFTHKLTLFIRLFFLLAAGAFLSLQQERNQSAGREERGGLKQPLFLPTPTITLHFSDVFVLLHRHTPAVCTPFFTISIYSNLCSLL